MKQFIGKHFVFLVLSVIGLGFLLMGLIFIGIGRSLQREVGQLEQLPVMELAQLSQSAVGVNAALEGRVSERNPFQFRPFVAYIRQAYQGQQCTRNSNINSNNNDNTLDCRSIWVEDERVTPPLWLDLPDGRVKLTNTDYTIRNPGFTQQSTPHLIERETKSYQGFRIGDPVFVIGQVATEAEEPAFKAELVYGGNREIYLANEQGTASLFSWIGRIVCVVGGLLIIVPLILRFVWKK